MGKYINETSDGTPLGARGKVQQLLNDGAKRTDATWKPNLICVIDNGLFEAAAYMYSEGEFEEFNDIDDRQKTWLIHEGVEEIAR
jgi:hypothetical protein